MINKIPSKVVAALILSIIGGIIAFVSMVYYFNQSSDFLFTQVGLSLLSMILFFAAGGLTYNTFKI